MRLAALDLEPRKLTWVVYSLAFVLLFSAIWRATWILTKSIYIRLSISNRFFYEKRQPRQIVIKPKHAIVSLACFIFIVRKSMTSLDFIPIFAAINLRVLIFFLLCLQSSRAKPLGVDVVTYKKKLRLEGAKKNCSVPVVQSICPKQVKIFFQSPDYFTWQIDTCSISFFFSSFYQKNGFVNSIFVFIISVFSSTSLNIHIYSRNKTKKKCSKLQ